MKSIKARFKALKKQNPNWSSYIAFAEAVRGSGATKRTIRELFNELVEKKDYSRPDKQFILNNLYTLTTKRDISQTLIFGQYWDILYRSLKKV